MGELRILGLGLLLVAACGGEDRPDMDDAGLVDAGGRDGNAGADGAPSACVPTDCDDGDACTADLCDGDACVNPIIDADGDGVPPATLGACGTDCNDGDPAVNPDVTEDTCDGVDSDCDGTVDEDGLTRWYADCDLDGFAESAAGAVDACAAPGDPPGHCTDAGGWTTVDPATSEDCCDEDARAFPGATWTASGMTTAGVHTPLPIACGGYDFDCNGTTERRWERRGVCGPPGCGVVRGWRGLTIPNCGVNGCWLDTCTVSGLMCNRTCDPARRFQDCR